MKIVPKIESFLKKLVTLNDSPHGIALGFAVGLFLSVIPTFGIGMVLAIALTPLLRTNLVATYLGTLVVNPVTGMFFYGLDYLTGSWLLGGGGGVELPRTLGQALALAGTVALPLYLGGFILALLLSILSYSLIFLGVKIYKSRFER